MKKILLPIYMPGWLYGTLRGAKRALRGENGTRVNLWGDRDVEYSFVAANMPSGPGKAMDFGCGPSNLSFLAARRGFQVIALDLELQTFYWEHPAIRFLQGDLLAMDLPLASFDLIVNCSAIEHVGLVGRYGITQGRPTGDLDAMSRMLTLLRPGGVMLLTIPCGMDATFAPIHRVYGKERLPDLLAGFAVQKEEFWMKDGRNRWKAVDRDAALKFQPSGDLRDPVNSSYALACYVLKKPMQEAQERNR